MDKVIYLPKKAIETITETKKHVFFMRYIPTDFKPSRDKLIVCETESRKPIGTLRSPVTYQCKSFIKNWWKLREKLAYMDDSFLGYLFSRKPFIVYVATDFIKYK